MTQLHEPCGFMQLNCPQGTQYPLAVDGTNANAPATHTNATAQTRKDLSILLDFAASVRISSSLMECHQNHTANRGT
jgi:hypothetical protein